jgi:hypothetical protein
LDWLIWSSKVNNEYHSHVWQDWIRQDTANILLAGSDFDETIKTPVWTPGVLDEEVLDRILSSVSNNKDTVVKVLTTATGEDTTVIRLECKLIGLNGNWDWPDSENSFKVVNAVCFEDVKAKNLTMGLLTVEFALIILSSVLVVSLKHRWVLLKVGESSSHFSTSATIVTIVLTSTVNKLLLGVRWELASLDKHGTFNSTSDGESPAWSALSLVLHWGNTSSSDPVQFFWQVIFVPFSNRGGFLDVLSDSVWSVAIQFLFLSGGPVCHEVDADSGSSVFRVVLLNLSKGLLEDLWSKLELRLSGVRLAVLWYKLHEFVVFSSKHLALGGLVIVKCSSGKGSRGTECGNDGFGVHYEIN